MSLNPRLQSEWQRLYGPLSDSMSDPLRDEQGCVRALVLELARPAEWAPLARVWQGVQTELHLPAPAIAITGVDGYQLWFSLAEPVALDVGQAFLADLQARYLADIPAHRLRCLPTAEEALPPVPALQSNAGVWSAFTAPDLAPLFESEPWLDIAPNPDGQAELLSRHAVIRAAEFRQAQALLRPAAVVAEPGRVEASAAPTVSTAEVAVALPSSPVTHTTHTTGPTETFSDPRQFLLAVMNDSAVALGLRIEAAKALLDRLPVRD